MVEPISYKFAYKHDFNDGVIEVKGLTFKTHFSVGESDYFPSNRRDRIYEPFVGFDYKVNEFLSVGANYAYQWSESDVMNTPAREYNRHLVGVSATVAY